MPAGLAVPQRPTRGRRYPIRTAAAAFVLAGALAAVPTPPVGGWPAPAWSGAGAGLPALSAPPAPPPPLVLAPLVTAGVAPTSAGTAAQLGALVRAGGFGPRYGLYVYDASRNRPVYAYNATGSYNPASTLKLLTSLAALQVFGPQHRFTTSVVSGTGSQIILVGGGDPTLRSGRRARAADYPEAPSIVQLANATAARLKAAGRSSVSLGYDSSLFSGPSANPNWPMTYLSEGIAARTSALWVDQAKLDPRSGSPSRRATDPAWHATQAFAAALKAAGVTVGGTIRSTKAAPAARQWAAVRSAPLASIVERCLTQSDNDIAEVLLRQVSRAKQHRGDGSYASGIAAVVRTLNGLGLSTTGARIADGSGLSRTNRVPLPLLAGALRVAAGSSHPQLRALLTGLPVAGFNGSLTSRFGAGALSGQGYVRAKTGTLSGVHTLAGIVYDRTGTLLVFAEAADAVPLPSTLPARRGLDRVAALLAGCGCG